MAATSLNTLQAGRAIAAIAVVLFHTNDTLELNKYLGHPVFPFLWSANSGVQFFFVLSGFVILLAHRKDIGQPAMVRSFSWKRFKRIYPPLWTILLLIIPFYFLVPSFGSEGVHDVGTILTAFLIIPTSQERILTSEWTLRHEILFYVAFVSLIWNRTAGIIIAVVWLLASAIGPFLHRGFPANFLFDINNLLFGMGMLACIGFRHLKCAKSWALTALAVGIAVFGAAWVLRWRNPHIHVDGTDFTFGVGAALIIWALASLERLGFVRVAAPIVFLGDASYAIYLAHYPAIALTTRMLIHARLHLSDAVIFVVVALVALTVGVIFHVAIEQPILKQFTNFPVSTHELRATK